MTEIPEYILKAASMAAFPGLPDGMTLEEAERRVEAALRAAWPLIKWRVGAEAECQLTGLTLEQIEIAAGLRHGPAAAGGPPR